MRIKSECVLGMLLLGVISTLLYFLILANTSETTPKTCVEKECVDYANTLLSNMDLTADPCDDFHQFACGSFASHNPIPHDKIQVGAWSKTTDLLRQKLMHSLNEPVEQNEPIHFQKLKKYYQMCIDTDMLNEKGLKPAQETIDSVGGWPVVTGNDPTNDWKTVLFKLRRQNYKTNCIFTIVVDQELKNSTIRAISWDQPNFKVKQAIMSKGKSDKTVQEYFQYMIDTAMLFGASETAAKEEMDQVLDFEILLSQSVKSMTEILNDFDSLYNMYSISQLEKEFPKFPWREFMNEYSPKNFTLGPDEKRIQLAEPEYARKLIGILETASPRVVVNYIIWRSVLKVMPHLNSEARTLEANFKAKILGQTEPDARDKQCMSNIQKVMLPIVSSLYVRKYFSQEDKRVASEFVKYIRQEFRKIINETDWLPEDKITALEKLDALIEFIGFPDELFDDNKINDIYGSIEIYEGEFLKSCLFLDVFRSERLFHVLHLPVNKTDWVKYAISSIVNAYYDPLINGIIFPAAILQGSYFNAERPKYVNFATAGQIIGHELSHGFDRLGNKFDKNGDLHNWWSETATKNFAEKEKCVIDQYDNFEVGGLKVKGNLTASENVADFGGYKVSYYSYKKWMDSHAPEPLLPGLNYTIQQLYWISAASIWCSHDTPESIKYQVTTDTHPPNEFRINGPLRNLDEFSRDFKCAKGSGMNPEKKCKPW